MHCIRRGGWVGVGGRGGVTNISFMENFALRTKLLMYNTKNKQKILIAKRNSKNISNKNEKSTKITVSNN